MPHKKLLCSPFLMMLYFCCFPNVVLAAQETPESLLSKVNSHFSQQSYKASAVYIRPSGMQSIDIEHEQKLERITYNTGSETLKAFTLLKDRQVSDANGKATAYFNKSQFKPLRYLHENLAKAMQSYKLAVGNNVDYIAGRQALRLSIISKNKDRYSYVYWFDADEDIILRTDTLNEQGELIERFVLTSLTFIKLADYNIEKTVQLASIDSVRYRNESIENAKQAILGWLPPNFWLFSIQPAYAESQTLVYKHLLLTDGFASVDIYIGENEREATLTRGQQLDAFHVFKHVLGGKKVSVEGRLPYETLKKIGLNIVLNNNHD